jgi:hypothetical protein
MGLISLMPTLSLHISDTGFPFPQRNPVYFNLIKYGRHNQYYDLDPHSIRPFIWIQLRNADQLKKIIVKSSNFL